MTDTEKAQPDFHLQAMKEASIHRHIVAGDPAPLQTPGRCLCFGILAVEPTNVDLVESSEATMRKLMMVALATLFLVACGAPSTTDFVQKAAMSDLYEIEAGKIASQKGQSAPVKGFGQMMVAAHSKTTEELGGIVASEKLKVDLPSKLDAKHQKLIDNLNAISNEDFDKSYAKQQVDGHQEAVDLFNSYAKKGDNAALKQFAQKTLPVIQEHLAEAKKLPQ